MSFNADPLLRGILALVCALAGVVSVPAFAASGATIRQERIQFQSTRSAVAVTGAIKGREIVDYQVPAGIGQSMEVNFKPSNLSAYFNVLPPGSKEAIFIGSIYGNRFEGQLPAEGVYTIRVYLMRSAARRNESTDYALEVDIKGRTAVGSFDRTLEFQGIRFRVMSNSEGSINTLRIVPSGLEIDNSPIARTIDGTVTGAEVADLNVDGSPEIYVYVTSAGSGSYGSLAAYSANRRKSLSEIYLPPVAQNKAASRGYMGHDEFAVVESTLIQRFPVYREGDTNARPTGGMRQLQYKLRPGEAGWVLKVDRVVDY